MGDVLHLRFRYRFSLFVAVLLSSVVFACPPQTLGHPMKVDAGGKGWRTANINGVWWLVDPQGKLFYSKGVDFVNPGLECERGVTEHAFFWANFYPSVDKWRTAVAARLRDWGFNTLGAWCDNSPKIGLPVMVDLELGRCCLFHWHDPFAPKMRKIVMKKARELTAPYRNMPQLIGYFSDNELGWWNSALFIWFLKAPWKNHTKRFLWRMIYNTYGGSWKALLVDWAPRGGAKNFEDLKKAGAALKLRPGGNGIRLADRFMGALARRYYKLMYVAIHAADPRALVLGDRLASYYNQVVIRAMGNNVDAISTNYNVDTPDGWVAPYYFDGLRKLDNKPVLVSEFYFSADRNRSDNLNEDFGKINPHRGHFMTVPTQAERAWGAGRALLNFARFPNVAGTQWFQYYDEPLGGRPDGEDYDMGLIDTANRPYRLLTEQFQKLNPVLAQVHEKSLRREAKRSAEPGPVLVPRAHYRIDLRDQTLVEWDKEKTLLSGFTAPAPYVPFAEVHLTWRPEGFYLFSLSQDYADPGFLAYRGEFPKSEAFQLHFTVKSKGVRNHLAIYLIPQKNPSSPGGFKIDPELFRLENGVCVQKLPTNGRLEKIHESIPRIAIEAFFPAKWFGVDKLKAGMRFKLNIAMMSYFREFTMTWAGKPEERLLSEPDDFREIVLK